MSQSVTLMTNYPEAWERLKARRARHPREDAIEEFTQWTLLGQPVGEEPAKVPEPEVLEVSRKEETQEEYIKRRTEHLLHKNIACRRGAGGKWFTIGGGGDAGCAFQVS